MKSEGWPTEFTEHTEWKRWQVERIDSNVLVEGLRRRGARETRERTRKLCSWRDCLRNARDIGNGISCMSYPNLRLERLDAAMGSFVAGPTLFQALRDEHATYRFGSLVLSRLSRANRRGGFVFSAGRSAGFDLRGAVARGVMAA